MAQGIFSCPKCGNEVIRDYGRKQKLRTNILVWEDGNCIAKCSRCSGEVSVPIILNLQPKPKKLVHVVIA